MSQNAARLRAADLCRCPLPHALAGLIEQKATETGEYKYDKYAKDANEEVAEIFAKAKAAFSTGKYRDAGYVGVVGCGHSRISYLAKACPPPLPRPRVPRSLHRAPCQPRQPVSLRYAAPCLTLSCVRTVRAPRRGGGTDQAAVFPHPRCSRPRTQNASPEQHGQRHEARQEHRAV